MLNNWRVAAFVGAGLMIMVVVIAALGSSNESATPASSAPPDIRQQLYNAFLRQAQSDIGAADPDLFCEPDYWLVVSELVPNATASDKALIQFAMGDACAEAGYLGDSPPFSPYYDDR